MVVVLMMQWTSTEQEELRFGGNLFFDDGRRDLQNRHLLRCLSQYMLERKRVKV
uniref:Uncharacterized protein n=1 Tax=Medicago truncatula TaxID=3880 RepID=A2Q3C5_MEDTR|nr:hypothetical protein MtrDRAFT_AC155880g25v2 [Medicago truncatula]